MTSPTLVQPPYPMLAKAGKLTDLAGAVAQGYLIEPKLDGIRCIAVIGDMAGVALYNRQLRNVTAAFPDIAAVLRAAAPGTGLLGPLVLDGEIVVTGGNGLPDFQLVQHRANRLRDVSQAVADYPARFVAFDVLSSGSVDYKGWTLEQRRRVLTEAAPTLAVATYTQDEADAQAAAMQGEGLMLKHVSSKYVPGARSPSWLKVKYLREVECYVGGVTFGIGKREPYFGGLLCGVYKPGGQTLRLTYIGTVGTGFDDATLEALTAKLYGLRTPTNPFVAQGSDWDLAYYVAPLVRIKVRFTDYTRDGIMRFPRYVGMA